MSDLQIGSFGGPSTNKGKIQQDNISDSPTPCVDASSTQSLLLLGGLITVSVICVILAALLALSVARTWNLKKDLKKFKSLQKTIQIPKRATLFEPYDELEYHVSERCRKTEGKKYEKQNPKMIKALEQTLQSRRAQGIEYVNTGFLN